MSQNKFHNVLYTCIVLSAEVLSSEILKGGPLSPHNFRNIFNLKRISLIVVFCGDILLSHAGIKHQQLAYKN